MYLLLQCGHTTGTALLLSAPSQSVTENYVRRPPGLNAESRLPVSAGHRISPGPTFKLREGKEERKHLAPSPGCRVLSLLSPFARDLMLAPKSKLFSFAHCRQFCL